MVKSDGLSGVFQCSYDPFTGKVRIIAEDLVNRLPCRDFLQNQFYRDACPANEWLPKHNIGVSHNEWLLHTCLDSQRIVRSRLARSAYNLAKSPLRERTPA